jgi:hypothetical protein
MTTPNRRNSDFQIAYMLAGKCHTPDAAYAMLLNLKEERELAIYEAEKVVDSFNGRDDVEARVFKRNFVAARKELETILLCIDRVQPLRKFSHLPDDEAHEACQREEWKLEFITRAENCLLSQGFIPTEQLAAMRSHPDFLSAIYPAIESTTLMIKSDRAVEVIKNANEKLLLLA